MEGFCRGCLTSYDEPTELLQYTEKNRRLFVYSTGIQVKRNDVITFQLCKYCFVSMKAASNFKKLCRASDKKLKSYFSLKDAGVCIDFSTFLKNSDDSTLFRLPLVSGNSTPANYNKAKEDDNESTCTSIRNFMKDILQDEEMADTEAHIIREVIEEEADLLDDTLDSHWLHDETSIDNDFPPDLSFSPFATPYSVNNDHCYTPKREDQSQIRKYFTSISPTIHHRTTNVITDLIKNNQSEKELSSVQNDSENEQAVNNSSIYADKEILDFNLPTIKEEKLILGISIDSENLMNSLTLPIDDSDIDTNNAELQSFDSLPSIPSIKNESISNLDLPIVDNINKDGIINPPKFYVNNDCTDYINASEEIEKIVDSKLSSKNDKKKLCPIDKNLERALKDENATEYSLDGLLVSPQVGSAASTPTINNILFGEIVISNKNIKSTGENVEHFEMLDEFFQTDSKATKTEIENLEEESEIVDKEDIEMKEVKETDNTPAYDQSQFDLENCFCNICQKNYQSVKALCIHSAKKHNIKIIKPRNTTYISRPRLCQLCGQEFRNLPNYHRHLKRHEKRPEPGVHKCDHCSLEFSSIYTLQRHKASHDPKPIEKEPGKYVCTICGATSKTIGNLRLHQRRHDKKYKCKCEECGKEFYTQSELTVHIRNHTGEKPFPCIHCERRFSRKDALVKHVKIHINDRPFGCAYCNQKFTTSTQLTVHIRKSIKCKRKRGILDTDTPMAIVKSELELDEETIVEIEEIPKLAPKEFVKNEMEVDEENIVKIKEIPKLATVGQLPYIDTELSN